jgi:enamine deaminase RidA (YjgF/YER057c/UK114 family)
MERIGALLKERKSSLMDVVKMIAFVTDSRHETDFRSCMSKAFPGGQPAQTFVNVARLPQSQMLIQIDATAVAAP